MWGNDKRTHEKRTYTLYASRHMETKMCDVYTIYTIWWNMRAWGCVYQMSVYAIYGHKRMHMHSVIFFLFLSLLSLCGAVAKLPDSASWGAFLAKVLQASTCFACLTSFYIYSCAPGFCLCLQSGTVTNSCANFWLHRTSACKS